MGLKIEPMPSQIQVSQVSGFTNIQGKLCESRVALWTLIKHHAIQLTRINDVLLQL